MTGVTNLVFSLTVRAQVVASWSNPSELFVSVELVLKDKYHPLFSLIEKIKNHTEVTEKGKWRRLAYF